MTSVLIAMPGDGLADPAEALQVVLDRVLAAHPAQHGVVARLDGQVEVLAHRRALGHRRDEPVRQVPRMRRHEAQPRDARLAVGGADAVDRAQQLGEVRPGVEVQAAAAPALRRDVPEALLGRQVVAVGVDVLAEERDLPVALVPRAGAPRRRSRRTGGCAPGRG